MTPDQQARAKQLEEQHRALQADMKTWGSMAQPPDLLGLSRVGSGRTSALPVPTEAWLVFRAACMEAHRQAIAENRRTFEAL